MGDIHLSPNFQIERSNEDAENRDAASSCQVELSCLRGELKIKNEEAELARKKIYQ
jgi:hypothetical protein